MVPRSPTLPSVPELDVQVVARELVIDRTELGSMRARAQLRHDRLALELDLEPGFCSVELDASVPLHVDLARPDQLFVQLFARSQADEINLDILVGYESRTAD